MSWRLERPGDSWLAAEGTITSGGLPRDPSVCVCVCRRQLGSVGSKGSLGAGCMFEPSTKGIHTGGMTWGHGAAAASHDITSSSTTL